MKNLKVNLGLLSLLAVIAVSVFFTSCEQEEIVLLDETVLEIASESKFKKEITLTDVSKKSSVVLVVSSDNEEILDLYNDKSLIVEPIFEKPTTIDEGEFVGGIEVADDIPGVHIKLLGKSLKSGAVGFRLLVDLPETGYAKGSGWYSGNKYFYSTVGSHHFYVAPRNSSNCVSAWFSQKWNWNSWADRSCWGPCSGYYLCTTGKDKSSSNRLKDYRLQANGNDFHVYWY